MAAPEPLNACLPPPSPVAVPATRDGSDARECGAMTAPSMAGLSAAKEASTERNVEPEIVTGVGGGAAAAADDNDDAAATEDRAADAAEGPQGDGRGAPHAEGAPGLTSSPGSVAVAGIADDAARGRARCAAIG